MGSEDVVSVLHPYRGVNALTLWEILKVKIPLFQIHRNDRLFIKKIKTKKKTTHSCVQRQD